MSHVAVVGAGIAGLTAAYSAVQAGHRVTVLEAANRPGGAVQPLGFNLPEGQLVVDAGAEAYASRSQLLAQLVEDLGLADQLVRPNPAGSWLYLPEIGAVPAPKLGMWGIPADPHAPEVVAALGAEHAARAAQDFELPMHFWEAKRAAGQTITIGELVTDRFGPAVLERLVAPVVAGVHSAHPDDVNVDKVAPGLVDKAIQLGSVAKAVSDMRSAAPPGAAVQTLRGGMQRLATALADYVQAHGELRCNTAVAELDTTAKTLVTGHGERIRADHIVLAVSAPAAHDLLSETIQLPKRPQFGAGVGLVTMILDAPALDDHPRGTGMLVSPAVTQVQAKAATHVTAKWQWAQQAAGSQAPHRHVLRLSYGRTTDPIGGSAAGHDTPDAQLVEYALADAATMFGLESEDLTQRLMATRVVRWREPMPLITADNSAAITAIENAIRATDWLHVTGAWFAGTGLAAITQHASAIPIYQLQ